MPVYFLRRDRKGMNFDWRGDGHHLSVIGCIKKPKYFIFENKKINEAIYSCSLIL